MEATATRNATNSATGAETGKRAQHVRQGVPVIGIGSAHTMVRVGSQHGVDATRVLAGTGIAIETLDDPEATTDLTGESTVAGNLSTLLPGNPSLGLQVAAQYRATTYGIFGWGVMCAPTLRAKLRFAQRFLGLSYSLCDIESVWNHPDGRLRLRVHSSALDDDVRPFFRDRTLGGIVVLLRDALPWPGWLHSVNFSTARPADAQTYERIVQAPVHYNQAYDEVVINTSYVDLRTPEASELSLSMAEQQCERLLDVRLRPSTTADSVKQRVLRGFPRVATIAEVAAAMHVSERALRRRLADESTSFTDIVDATRREVAADLLGSGVPPSKAALHVGYASATSFNHAFQRWYGRCPRDYLMLHSQTARLRYPDAAADYAATPIPGAGTNSTGRSSS